MIEHNTKAKRLDNGEWICGWYHEINRADSKGRAFIIPSYASCLYSYEVDPTTVSRSIGKDQYFEGDIIEIIYDTSYSEQEKSLHCIEYQAGQGYPAFDLVPWIDCEMNALSWLFSNSDPSVLSYNVVGNIHDNPELLQANG